MVNLADNLDNIIMPKSHKKTHIKISLTDWPKNPVEKSIFELTPRTSIIVSRSRIDLKELLPMSMKDFLRNQIWRRENYEEMITDYQQFNQKRIEQLKYLQNERNKYQNYQNIYQSAEDFQKSSHHKIKLQTLPYSEINESPTLKSKPSKHQLAKTFKNAIGSIQITAQENIEEIKPIQSVPTTARPLKSLSPKRCPDSHLIFQNREIKQKGHQSRKKKRLTNSKSMRVYFHQHEAHYERVLKHEKSPKKTPACISKPQSTTVKKQSSSLSKSKKLVRTPQKGNQKLGFSQALHRNSKFTDNRKSQLKTTRLDYYGSPTKLLKNNTLKNSQSRDQLKKEARKNRLTHGPVSRPLNEYYNDESNQIFKNDYIPKFQAFVRPIFDEMITALEELGSIMENQRVQLQSIENLSRQEGKPKQNQKRRLQKIHSIERDQLKSHIVDLKRKVERIKRQNLSLVKSL